MTGAAAGLCSDSHHSLHSDRIRTRESSVATTVSIGMKIKTAQSCSVQRWLDQSLEERGIDARVYSTYIWSLMQQPDDDTDDQCHVSL